METVIAVAAAAVSLVSLFFVWRQVRIMERQTDLQQQIAEDAAQPYVWADVRIDRANGWIIDFVLGNSGLTVATDITVTVDPHFPEGTEKTRFVDPMHQALERGVSWLAPGRELTWPIGPSPELVNREGSLEHQVRIEFLGTSGKAIINEYVIDFAGLKHTTAIHAGSLRDIAKSIDEVAKRLPK